MFFLYFYGLYFLFLGFPLWLNILNSKNEYIYKFYVYVVEMFLYVVCFNLNAMYLIYMCILFIYKKNYKESCKLEMFILFF